MRSWLSKRLVFRKGSSLHADESGASAIEFGLLAPVLLAALMSTVDLGLALNQKMEIDRSLRASADSLMAGTYEDEPTTAAAKKEKVRKLVQAIATGAVTSGNADGADSSSPTDLDIDVDRFCACPESLSTEESNCDTLSCDDAAARYLFYRVSATQQYDAVFLPQTIPLNGSVLVQVE